MGEGGGEEDPEKDEENGVEEMKKEEDADMENKVEEKVAELTEEEQNIWFKSKDDVKDLKEAVLNQHFSQFSIPDEDEGFDEIRYEWQDESASRDYLRAWILDRKLTSRIDNLQPSEWFAARLAE